MTKNVTNTMNQRSILNPRRLAVNVTIGILLALAPHTAHAMSRVYESQTTYYDDQGMPVRTVTEQVTKKVMEARERRESFRILAEQQAAQSEVLARALPPVIANPETLDPQAQRDYMAWGRSAGYVATTIRMAEALDPETTSTLQAGKEIELATINKGLNWARVILGTPGGAVLIDRGFDVLQGSDPDQGGIGEGGILISNIGHRVKDGGQDGGSGGGGASDDEFADLGVPGVGGSGGATETGVNDAPINITINNRSANQQAWDSSYSPVLEWAHDNGFTSPVIGEGGALAPNSTEERGGVSLGAELF